MVWYPPTTTDTRGLASQAVAVADKADRRRGICQLCYVMATLLPLSSLLAPRADRLSAHSDYINPIDLCNRLNTYIIPEVAVHGFLTFLFLINGYWIPLILNLPLLGWNAKKYVDTGWRIRVGEKGADRVQDHGQHASPGCHRDLPQAQRPQEGEQAQSGSEIGRDGANGRRQESFTKLGFHLVLFFFYLYSMIVALIKDEAH